jgi:outer membrane biosynthesis protein TonB
MGFLLPLEGFCKLAGNDIPDEVLSGAYEAMTATATATPTTEQRRPATTRKAEQSEKPENPKTTQKEHRVTETLTSTMVRTTTDGEGRTLEIYVPVVIGPDTMSFGKTVTSTVGGESSATEAPSSSSATPSPTAAPTQEEQPQEAPSSTTSADAPERTSNSNGSPFENMQAEAGQWRVSSLFLGLGAAAGMFMRL